jgi:hypothetical protein
MSDAIMRRVVDAMMQRYMVQRFLLLSDNLELWGATHSVGADQFAGSEKVGK